MQADYGTRARQSMLATWQSLPRPQRQASVPVLYHRPSVIARQLAANRSASATIRTWDWCIAAIVIGAAVLVASHLWD